MTQLCEAEPKATATPGLDVTSFWYVVADSRELRRGTVLARTVLDRPLAVFRDDGGRPVALEDRCAHRATPLSAGRVDAGRLRCGYHGWQYDGSGHVTEIPSLGPGHAPRGCAVRSYEVQERDDYVYVRLGDAAAPAPDIEPFALPHRSARGFRHLRLVNRFPAPVLRCVQNFVDIPHTAYVHAGLFRSPRAQRLAARVERRGGSVLVRYLHERANLGLFARFLNRRGTEIEHVDAFHAPNAVVRWLAQRIIDQDIAILGRQTAAIRALGERSTPAPADTIHAFIEAIHRDMAEGRDPRPHPGSSRDIEFYV